MFLGIILQPILLHSQRSKTLTGWVLSPVLLSIYIDEMLTRCIISGFGCRICHIVVYMVLSAMLIISR